MRNLSNAYTIYMKWLLKESYPIHTTGREAAPNGYMVWLLEQPFYINCIFLYIFCVYFNIFWYICYMLTHLRPTPLKYPSDNPKVLLWNRKSATMREPLPAQVHGKTWRKPFPLHQLLLKAKLFYRHHLMILKVFSVALVLEKSKESELLMVSYKLKLMNSKTHLGHICLLIQHQSNNPKNLLWTCKPASTRKPLPAHVHGKTRRKPFLLHRLQLKPKCFSTSIIQQCTK